ncbi:MAG: EAL domain-containing protein [Exilibacterium sp.]
MDISIKILLIDEEQAEYLLLAQLLNQVGCGGYRLSWCNTLDGGLDKALSGHFDIILLDYYWRGTTGSDLLRCARAKGCRAPIVVMSAEMVAELDRDIIRAGASDYLIKGQVDAQLLERTVRYAIERKAAELKLSRLAHYDILTNVPNRILFRDRLEHALQLAERGQMSLTLMYLDLDGFKQVNDGYGHDAGDALIRACAQRLCECMRKSDSVARIGGDEFTLLLEGTEQTGDIAHIAEKVLEAVIRPYRIGSHQVLVGCSLGIAVYPVAGRDAESLLKHADLAMYQAKQREGSAYVFYTEAMNIEVHRQLLLESNLQRALGNNEFCLYYQPRVELSSGRVVGLEALLRWMHPQRGPTAPEAFISVVEDTGMIVALGDWIIRQGCQDLNRLLERGRDPGFVAINLSLRQFFEGNLVARVASIIKQVECDGSRIEFELSETAVMENMEMVSLHLRALSNLGANFSLDDFGTGYSSFMYLQRLPIRTLKIDQRFIGNITRDDDDRELVKAMISLAHSLNKQVVAVGVETPEQLALLREFNCDQVQGFYLSHPLDLESICHLLNQDTPFSAATIRHI